MFPEMLGDAWPWAPGDAGGSLWVPGEMLVVGEAEPEMSSLWGPSTTLGMDPSPGFLGARAEDRGVSNQALGQQEVDTACQASSLVPLTPTPSSGQNWMVSPAHSGPC